MSEPLKITAWNITTENEGVDSRLRPRGRLSTDASFDISGTIEIKWARGGRKLFERMVREHAERFEREIAPAIKRAIAAVVDREAKRAKRRKKK